MRNVIFFSLVPTFSCTQEGSLYPIQEETGDDLTEGSDTGVVTEVSTTYDACDPYGVAWDLPPEGEARPDCLAIQDTTLNAAVPGYEDRFTSMLYYGACTTIVEEGLQTIVTDAYKIDEGGTVPIGFSRGFGYLSDPCQELEEPSQDPYITFALGTSLYYTESGPNYLTEVDPANLFVRFDAYILTRTEWNYASETSATIDDITAEMPPTFSGIIDCPEEVGPLSDCTVNIY
jgi:hypothetical protein